MAQPKKKEIPYTSKQWENITGEYRLCHPEDTRKRIPIQVIAVWWADFSGTHLFEFFSQCCARKVVDPGIISD